MTHNEHGLPVHPEAGGEPRVLGHVARQNAPRLASAAPSVPESKWVEFEYEDCPVPVKDQDGKGACNGHAAATSLEFARWVAGLGFVELSPWFIYAILCNGADVGSNIGDALSLLGKTGTCPFPDVPYATINPRRLTDANRNDAARFRIEIGNHCPDFAAMMSETQLRRPGNFSICVGPNFNDLDADGVPGFWPGAGNHAVTFGLGAKRAKDGRWLIKARNSWSARWGLNGDFWVDARRVEDQLWFESYSVRAVQYDPKSPDNPPAAT